MMGVIGNSHFVQRFQEFADVVVDGGLNNAYSHGTFLMLPVWRWVRCIPSVLRMAVRDSGTTICRIFRSCSPPAAYQLFQFLTDKRTSVCFRPLSNRFSGSVRDAVKDVPYVSDNHKVQSGFEVAAHQERLFFRPVVSYSPIAFCSDEIGRETKYPLTKVPLLPARGQCFR